MGFSLHIVPSPNIRTSAATLGLSLTAIVSSTIKSKGGKNTPALIMSSATRKKTHTQKCTTHSHQENGCYYWFLGWCARHCSNTEAWVQKVFLSLRSYNRSATPDQWLALYLDRRSIKLRNRQKCCIAAIISLIRATPHTSYEAHCIQNNRQWSNMRKLQQPVEIGITPCGNRCRLPDLCHHVHNI